MEDHPLSFCESFYARKNISLPITTARTLKGQMELLVGEVEEIIRSQLNDQRIGLMYDAWTQNGYHFVATYPMTPPLNPTSVMTSRPHFLLSFETTDFGANAIIDHFDSVLDRYGISLDQLCCFIGDNASVNVAISRRLGIPLVGYASHRLHLAPEAHMAPVKPMIKKVSAVMKCSF